MNKLFPAIMRILFTAAITFLLFFVVACLSHNEKNSSSKASGDDDDAGDDDSGLSDLPNWLLNRPYLQNRSVWRQDIDMNAPPSVRQLGAIGVGNGKVFGIIGNQYPLAAWHNLEGPSYQKNLKWFSDKVPYVLAEGRQLDPIRQSISYVRRTPIVITEADDGELEWTSVNFAPRGTNKSPAENALISVWIMRNISGRDITDIILEIRGYLAAFQKGSLQEGDLSGRHLYVRPISAQAAQGTEWNDIRIPFGPLTQGEEKVIVVPMAFIEDPGDPELIFNAITEAGIDSLLENTVSWWNEWASGILQVETPDAKINDLLDALALSIKVNQATSGGLTQMSQYSYTWLRDTYGPSILFPLIGFLNDFKDMLDYLYGISVINGNISNALPVDADLSDLPPPPDWRNLGTLTGRTRAEGPSFLVLEYEKYYKATGDLDTLAERYDMLWHALAHQQIVDDCLQYFSGDETFEDVMEATFGENIFNEPDESTLSSYSSFAMIRAAGFMSQAADLLGRKDDAKMFAKMADDFRKCLDETFWMPDRGFYAVKADTATREPYPLPYEDIDTMPLWLDVLDPDDPKTIENFETIMQLLGHSNGTLYSHISPFYDFIFPQINVGVQTGMSHGYWLVNLDKMFHPMADEAFRRLVDVVTPAGFTDEALIVDDYSHLSLIREGIGIVCDISARYRSWESGIIGHALIYHLTGYDYDIVEGTAKLAPHLPPEWDHFKLNGLSYGHSRFDLEVRKNGANGRTIEITTDSQTSFTLALTVPINGKFTNATINGNVLSATAETNAYGRTIVRFQPFVVPTNARTEIVVYVE